MTHPRKSIRALLSRSIDYAGLFPPAALDMPAAAHNFATYQTGKDEWMLGRFVFPVSSIARFELAVEDLLPRTDKLPAWRLSALCGHKLEQDIEEVLKFNECHADPFRSGGAAIESLEFKISKPEEIEKAAVLVPKGMKSFIEFSVSGDIESFLSECKAVGACAKLRTGGVTPELFPSSQFVARFIAGCLERGVPFKATAGLHHPIRAVYPLTYEIGSPMYKMYGFFNLFLAAAFARKELPLSDLVTLLEEESILAFGFSDSGITWHAHSVSVNDLIDTRKELAISFGSCSFEDPVSELRSNLLL